MARVLFLTAGLLASAPLACAAEADAAAPGVLVLPPSAEPREPVMPAEWRAKTQADPQDAPQGAGLAGDNPGESAPERKASPIEPSAQVGFGPILIDRPDPRPFDLSALKIDPPPEKAAPEMPVRARLAIAPEAAKALIEPHRQRLRLRANVTEQILAAYQSRDWQPFWLDANGAPAGIVAGLVAALSTAGEEGLDSRRLLSLLPGAVSHVSAREPIAAEERAGIDLMLSLAAFVYAQDARGGRLEPSKLSAMLTPELHLPPAEEVLERLAGAETAAAARAVLAGYNPQHPGYVALKQALARLNTEPAPEPEMTASTQRARAPRAAREAHPDRIGTLIANMERWRWLPPELGRTHILVNIPDFRLEMMEDGAPVFETRVIVGKPERPTPVFSDRIEFLVVNPSWFIPPTILRNDVLPRLAADPGYAERMGYQVIRRGNSISVRQPPGERNALGQVKFMFPNTHAVYLHDTPGRHLFASETRAFSSGCIRVDRPFALAEHLLAKRQGFSERQLRAMVGQGERTIRLEESVPVHLAYFTLTVDAGGALVHKPDLYGHDARIRHALAL